MPLTTYEDVYPTAALKKIYTSEDVQNLLAYVKNRLANDRDLGNKSSDIDLEGPDKEELLKGVEVIKADIVRIYQEAGITIAEADFPTIFLYSAEKAYDKLLQENPDIELNENSLGGKYNPDTHSVDLYAFNHDHQIKNLQMLHHELHHAVGRKLHVTYPMTKGTEYGLTSSGYVHSPDGLIVRGMILEEGLVQFHSFRFILESEDPLLAETRERYVHQANAPFTPEHVIEDAMKREHLSREQAFCAVNLRQTGYPTRYMFAEQLIRDIQHQAEAQNMAADAATIYRLLLEGRFTAKSRRQLIHLIDQVYHKRVGRLLFIADFTDETVDQIWKLAHGGYSSFLSDPRM